MSNSSGFSNKRKSQSPFSSQVKKMKMKSSSKKRTLPNSALPFMQRSPEILSLEKQIKLMQDKITLIERNQRRLQQENQERQSSSLSVAASSSSTNGAHDNSKRNKAEDEASRPSTSQRTNCKRKRKNTDLSEDQGMCTLFSCESSSRKANVRPSVCLSVCVLPLLLELIKQVNKHHTS